jgi:coproporphyrinogen III oxidase-like Fe-S oxidoreductase
MNIVRHFCICVSDSDLFAVNLDVIYNNPAITTDDIDQRKEDLLRRAKDLGFDAIFIEDNLYYVTKTTVSEEMTDRSAGSEPQSESVTTDMKQLVSEVMGNDVVVTQILKYEKHPG